MTDILTAPPAELPGWAAGLVNLASPRLGSEAAECSDDFFAPMARMIQDAPAVFRTDVYDDHGKWMDGWESRRKRGSGHDWCILRLGVRGAVAGVDIDTSFFTGNYPLSAAVLAASGDRPPADPSGWTEIVPATPLGPSAHHFIEAVQHGPFDWIRLDIHPDGGVARLRVFGEPAPDWGADDGAAAELSALRNGGKPLAWSDAHYGDPWAILTEGRGRDMGDGWETRRRREPGNDWIIVRLGAPGQIERVEVDTAHYKGNFPDRASLQAAMVNWGAGDAVTAQAIFWPELMGERKLSADSVHVFEGDDLARLGPVSHVKLNTHPDGGISRLRVFGRRA